MCFKQFVGKLPTNCFSVFDHFVGLALKGLNYVTLFPPFICLEGCMVLIFFLPNVVLDMSVQLHLETDWINFCQFSNLF